MPNTEFTDIESLPTLLDILNLIAQDEVNWDVGGNVFRPVYPSYHEQGKFVAREMPNGEARLNPCGRFVSYVYRGQSSYFEECKPSLYRKEMTDSKIFLERVKLKELESLIDKHPLTNIFKNGLSWFDPDRVRHPITLAIDHQGLAQHYGIKTDLIDLTNDKWVAAFFACTDHIDGQYVVHKAENGKSGVFYRMNPLKYNFAFKNNETFRSVGLQPFPRPGEQSGYVLKLEPNQNFNDEAEVIRFRHDDRVSELIFNYANRSNKYFPYDIFQEKVQQIIISKTFSNSSILQAVKEFYPNVDKCVIESYIKEEGIESQDAPMVEFTDKEIADFYREWPNREKEYCSKVVIQLSYSGPITFLDRR
jgi:hypothetical protein